MSLPTWNDRPSRDFTLWGLSFLFHLCLMLTVGLIWSPDSTAPPHSDDRVVGVALRHSLPQRDEPIEPEDQPDSAEDSPAADATSNQQASAAQLATTASLGPPSNTAVVDLDAALTQMLEGDAPSINSATMSQLSTTSSEATIGDPNQRLKLDGEPGSASLFGLSGTGHRFVYVVDRSDSMNSIGGRPLRAAKRELKRSLSTLTEKQQFQLIFYNDTPKRYVEPGSQMQLLLGERSTVAAAERYIDALAAFGGTEHMAALKMALRLGPDVLFFLTDARVPELNAAQLEEVRRLAERSGTTIYCIEFGTDGTAPHQSFLKQLASENGGKYRYLDISSL